MTRDSLGQLVWMPGGGACSWGTAGLAGVWNQGSVVGQLGGVSSPLPLETVTVPTGRRF